MVEIVERAGEFTAWQLANIEGIKLVALLIAATAGFRGEHIFHAVFIGVAGGLLCHGLFPQIPLGLAIGHWLWDAGHGSGGFPRRVDCDFRCRYYCWRLEYSATALFCCFARVALDSQNPRNDCA